MLDPKPSILFFQKKKKKIWAWAWEAEASSGLELRPMHMPLNLGFGFSQHLTRPASAAPSPSSSFRASRKPNKSLKWEKERKLLKRFFLRFRLWIERPGRRTWIDHLDRWWSQYRTAVLHLEGRRWSNPRSELADPPPPPSFHSLIDWNLGF